MRLGSAMEPQWRDLDSGPAVVRLSDSEAVGAQDIGGARGGFDGEGQATVVVVDRVIAGKRDEFCLRQ